MSSKHGNEDAQTVNRQTVESLHRLSVALAELDDRSPNVTPTAGSAISEGEGSGSNDHGISEEGRHLSHWRLPVPTTTGGGGGSGGVEDNDNNGTSGTSGGNGIPREVADGYKMLTEGAEVVKATSTKYTLIGKIDMNDGIKLAKELRQGCELLSTGALILHTPVAGMSRSSRHYIKRSARSVVATVINLISAFTSHDALEEGNENLAAQKCGSVWSACDGVVRVPRGNRNGMRRDLLTWAGECNETFDEFDELVQLGVAADDGNDADGNDATDDTSAQDGDNNDDEWDEFGGGAGHQYSATELPVATACLALIKCSRGTINATLKACECAGDEVGKCSVGDIDGEDTNNDSSSDTTRRRRRAVLNWIGTLHDMARGVGEGVTDLGCLMYPPLAIGGSNSDEESNENKLMAQVKLQRDAILAVSEYILDAVPDAGVGAGGDGSADEQGAIIPMSEEVLELAGKLRAACQKRYGEVEAGIRAIR